MNDIIAQVLLGTLPFIFLVGFGFLRFCQGGPHARTSKRSSPGHHQQCCIRSFSAIPAGVIFSISHPVADRRPAPVCYFLLAGGGRAVEFSDRAGVAVLHHRGDRGGDAVHFIDGSGEQHGTRSLSPSADRALDPGTERWRITQAGTCGRNDSSRSREASPAAARILSGSDFYYLLIHWIQHDDLHRGGLRSGALAETARSAGSPRYFSPRCRYGILESTSTQTITGSRIPDRVSSRWVSRRSEDPRHRSVSSSAAAAAGVMTGLVKPIGFHASAQALPLWFALP